MGTPEPRHLFVCGLHRSGTSPLHRLLRAQPGVSGFSDTSAKEDEGQHLQDVTAPARDHGGPGLFAFDPRSHLLGQDATEERATRLRAQWARHWDADAQWLVEKSPPNIVRMPFLAQVYPEARFLVLVRHPIAVSLATWKWRRGTTLETLLRHWLAAHDTARVHAQQLERVRWLSFEEFVLRPREAVRWAMDLPAVHEVEMPEPIRPGANDKYFERWQAMRGRLASRRTMETLVARLEAPMWEHGYSLVDVAAHPQHMATAGR